jgi:uncharacterized membrane protein YfcA
VDTDSLFYLVAIPAVLIAAVSKGGFGAGAGFVSAPLLALVMEPRQAVGLLLPLLMLMDVTGLRTYWRKWSWPHARRLMLGAILGVALGTALFRSVSSDGIRLIVGGFAVGFVVFQVVRELGWLRAADRPWRRIWGYVWGGVTGFTSFVSHSGGPPASIYLLGCRLDKTTYQATTVLVFWWANMIKFPPYLALGMFTGESARANLILAPVAVLGVLLGAWAHTMIEQKTFFRLTYALLLVTGSKLIWDALS